MKALENLFHLHLLNLPVIHITSKNAIEVIERLAPRKGAVFTYNKGRILKSEARIEMPKLPFEINFLIKNNNVYLIKSFQISNKCDYCGDYYMNSHTCDLRRRDFYFHHIHSKSSDWWETIQFQPIGAVADTKRLFITYDVETYTWHGKYGKQLVPFMLVFRLTGDQDLVDAAALEANTLGWSTWKQPYTYFIITPQKGEIGRAFEKFRCRVKSSITKMLWDKFCLHNPHLEEIKNERNLISLEDIPFDTLKKLKLCGEPSFIEIYIVGHNICGFDEIVLAAQVIHNREDMPAAFKIQRNFMPRNGKILFNDISYCLPNPKYERRTQFYEWHRGKIEAKDHKYQFVKVMVRDTFALTHTSLRNAAKAYELPVEKGSCPYEAVNDFYRLGTYLKDEDGFPNIKYWSSVEEYKTNKALWKETKTGAYDIVQQTLHYCAQDVVVTSALVSKLLESYKTFIDREVHLPESNFNVFQRPTISSNSHAIFKQILYREISPQRGHFESVLLAPSHEMYDYVRQSIRGGRCYPTYIGILQKPIYVYDICGMYASALTHPFPAGQPLNPYERALAAANWSLKLEHSEKIDYFDTCLLPGIFTIDADPPAEIFLDELPPFCSRKGGRLCWTNEPLRGEVATSVDVITLHNRGWKVRLLPDEKTTIFPEWRCVAQEYVQLNIEAKEKADKEKNQTLRSIAKLLSNALYGSFATKLDNKKIVFSDQLETEMTKTIARGNFSVKSSSFIETDNMSAEIMPAFVVAYPPAPREETEEYDQHDSSRPFIPSTNHVTYKYKPIIFMDAEDEDLCLHTLELNSPLIQNNRYASHIASFVLAWTRVFIAEWAEFIYAEDRGKPLSVRPLKSVYGDTDSLFLTEEGHKLMEEKGKHRIKKNGGNLVFDPKNPKITWLVECETQCEICKGDAFSSESVFLAPKLYALKNTICSKCGHVGKGKLRAKGHATTELSYDLMRQCYMEDALLSGDTFQTTRMSLKRTLASNQSQAAPFTVTETTLTRTLRPWKDKTLVNVDQNRLMPYSRSRPNPRNKNVCWMTLPWDI